MEEHLVAVKMNKIIITILGILILVGLVTAGITLSSIDFSQEDKNLLANMNITTLNVSACIPQNENFCEVLVQDIGIYKKIKNIRYRECELYDTKLMAQIDEEIEQGNYTTWNAVIPTDFCLKYKTLTETELNNLVDDKVEELLNKQLDIIKQVPTEEPDGLTDERIITIE